MFFVAEFIPGSHPKVTQRLFATCGRAWTSHFRIRRSFSYTSNVEVVPNGIKVIVSLFQERNDMNYILALLSAETDPAPAVQAQL